MRQAYANGKWREGLPTEQGQQYRYMTPAGWVYGFYELPAVTDMRITKRSFLKKRMTEAEYVRIDLASYGQTENAAKIRRFMEMFRSSLYFDLGLPSNRTDLQLMEDLGLLDGVGRAVEILSPPVNYDERYEG